MFVIIVTIGSKFFKSFLIFVCLSCLHVMYFINVNLCFYEKLLSV